MIKCLLLWGVLLCAPVFATLDVEEVYLNKGGKITFNGINIPYEFEEPVYDEFQQTSKIKFIGNRAVFRICFKTKDAQDIKTFNITFADKKLLGYDANFKGNKNTDLITEHKNTIKDPKNINAFIERNNTDGDNLLDRNQNPHKKVMSIFPNFGHSEQYFFNDVIQGGLRNHLMQMKLLPENPQDLDFVLLSVASTNSACRNCFQALRTLISQSTTFHQNFIRSLFGVQTSYPPIHLLYTATKAPTISEYRAAEVREVFKNPYSAVEINSSEIRDRKALFIHQVIDWQTIHENEKTHKEKSIAYPIINIEAMQNQETLLLKQGQEEEKFSKPAVGQMSSFQSQKLMMSDTQQEKEELLIAQKESIKTFMEEQSQHQNDQSLEQDDEEYYREFKITASMLPTPNVSKQKIQSSQPTLSQIENALADEEMEDLSQKDQK